MDINPQEIIKSQGTRLSDDAPWETYGKEMESKMSPELEEAVKRYEERFHKRASQEAEEELARQKELSIASASEYRWVNPEEYEHIAPRIGKILHSSQLIKLLREECDLECWYTPHMLPGRLTLTIRKPYGKPEFGVWLMNGYMPEYSIMKFDAHLVPLDERMRGWRTVLLQLLIKKAITEESVLDTFGAAEGPASFRFNGLLYEFRNHLVVDKEG